MIHLSMTGYGSVKERMLCHADTVAHDDVCYHAMYCSATLLAHDDVCPECKQVWLCDDQDDNSEEL